MYLQQSSFCGYLIFNECPGLHYFPTSEIIVKKSRRNVSTFWKIIDGIE